FFLPPPTPVTHTLSLHDALPICGIGSLLLGLYNDEGLLDHVGFTSSFNAEQRKELRKVVEPLTGPPGFTGRAPGGPSRWSTKRSTEWQPLKPKLVCEVQYDHFSGGRFRMGRNFCAGVRRRNRSSARSSRSGRDARRARKHRRCRLRLPDEGHQT